MLGPSLTIIPGVTTTFRIVCDGTVIGTADSYLQATTLMRQLRAARAFAAEELRHVLSTNTKREA